MDVKTLDLAYTARLETTLLLRNLDRLWEVRLAETDDFLGCRRSMLLLNKPVLLVEIGPGTANEARRSNAT